MRNIKLWCIIIISIILISFTCYNKNDNLQRGGQDIDMLNSIQKDIENARKERKKIQEELSKINIEIKLTNKKPITNDTIKELNELYIKTDILLDKENKTINILEKAVKKITDIEKKLLKNNYKKTKGGSLIKRAQIYTENSKVNNEISNNSVISNNIVKSSNNHECSHICNKYEDNFNKLTIDIENNKKENGGKLSDYGKKLDCCKSYCNPNASEALIDFVETTKNSDSCSVFKGKM